MKKLYLFLILLVLSNCGAGSVVENLEPERAILQQEVLRNLQELQINADGRVPENIGYVVPPAGVRVLENIVNSAIQNIEYKLHDWDLLGIPNGVWSRDDSTYEDFSYSDLSLGGELHLRNQFSRNFLEENDLFFYIATLESYSLNGAIISGEYRLSYFDGLNNMRKDIYNVDLLIEQDGVVISLAYSYDRGFSGRAVIRSGHHNYVCGFDMWGDVDCGGLDEFPKEVARDAVELESDLLDYEFAVEDAVIEPADILTLNTLLTESKAALSSLINDSFEVSLNQWNAFNRDYEEYLNIFSAHRGSASLFFQFLAEQENEEVITYFHGQGIFSDYQSSNDTDLIFSGSVDNYEVSSSNNLEHVVNVNLIVQRNNLVLLVSYSSNFSLDSQLSVTAIVRSGDYKYSCIQVDVDQEFDCELIVLDEV